MTARLLAADIPAYEDVQPLDDVASFRQRIAATSWGAQRVDLAPLMRKGFPEYHFLPTPRLGSRLVYARSTGLISGHKKSFKSWITSMIAADMIEAGRPVIYVDRENGPLLFTRRLLLLGVDPEIVSERFIYVPFPRTPPLEELGEQVALLAEAMPNGLLIYDSLRSLLSSYQLSSNDDTDIERVAGPIMGAVKNQSEGGEFSALIIDHANRSTTAGQQYAHGGSHAKSEAVDVVYYVEKKTEANQDIDADRRGTVMLAPHDDREGELGGARWFEAGGQGRDDNGRSLPLHWQPIDAPEAALASYNELAVRAAHVVWDNGESMSRKNIAEALEAPDNGTLNHALNHAREQGWLAQAAPRKPYTPGDQEPPDLPDLS